MAEKNYLVVIETQKVKSYLFASPTLRETRGASILLDALNRVETEEILKQFPNSEKIYLGGGSGRILFENSQEAECFANAVRDQYRQGTYNSRVSVEVVPRQAGELFPQWMSRGVHESQKNKLARNEAIPSIAGRWIRACSSCGREPAEVPYESREVAGRYEHYLCRSCDLKRQSIATFYREDKRNWNEDVPLPELSRLQHTRPNFILTTLSQQFARRHPQALKILLPQDFNQIAENSKPRNYIGFIYADGNRMGEVIQTMGHIYSDAEHIKQAAYQPCCVPSGESRYSETSIESAKQAYAAFSSIVDQATRESAVEAVLECVPQIPAITPRCEPAMRIPAEFVMAGGDDLILVVPAHTALHIAARFIALFQEQTRLLQQTYKTAGKLAEVFAPKGLTTSAGVVLAHASYPASQLMDLAGELMKLAKRKSADLARGREKQTEGTLDFMVLHTPGSEGVKKRRKREYEGIDKTTGHRIQRTERPYTAREMMSLIKRIRALKDSDIPRTKLKALYPLIFRGLLSAQYEAQFIKQRLQITDQLHEGPLQELINELKFFPFRKSPQGEWSTPLSELIEIYDFIPKSTSNSDGHNR